MQSIEYAARLVRDGVSIYLAPEGTRSRDGRIGTLKKGGFHLALGTGAPIVPVAIQRDHRHPAAREPRDAHRTTVSRSRSARRSRSRAASSTSLMDEVRDFLVTRTSRLRSFAAGFAHVSGNSGILGRDLGRPAGARGLRRPADGDVHDGVRAQAPPRHGRAAGQLGRSARSSSTTSTTTAAPAATPASRCARPTCSTWSRTRAACSASTTASSARRACSRARPRRS